MKRAKDIESPHNTVPHILCRGFTQEETEDASIELHYLGIENVIALRGDDTGHSKPIPKGRPSNEHYDDLIEQVKRMNNENYHEEDIIETSKTKI